MLATFLYIWSLRGMSPDLIVSPSCPEIVGKSGEVCGCGVVCPEMLSKSGEFH